MNELDAKIRRNIQALVGRGRELTQADLAKAVGIDPGNLSKILSGAHWAYRGICGVCAVGREFLSDRI